VHSAKLNLGSRDYAVFSENKRGSQEYDSSPLFVKYVFLYFERFLANVALEFCKKSLWDPKSFSSQKVSMESDD
jgi:hypothetical protein